MRLEPALERSLETGLEPWKIRQPCEVSYRDLQDDRNPGRGVLRYRKWSKIESSQALVRLVYLLLPWLLNLGQFDVEREPNAPSSSETWLHPLPKVAER